MKTENNKFAKAEMLIRKPVSEVFQAFVDPEITSKFWLQKAQENSNKIIKQNGHGRCTGFH